MQIRAASRSSLDGEDHECELEVSGLGLKPEEVEAMAKNLLRMCDEQLHDSDDDDDEGDPSYIPPPPPKSPSSKSSP